MAADFRNSGIAGSVGAQSAPIVNITDSRNSQMNSAMITMMVVQFLLLLMLSWKFLFSGFSDNDMKEIKTSLNSISENKAYQSKIEVMEQALKLSGKKELADALEENRRLKIQVEDSNANRLAMSDSLNSTKRKHDLLSSKYEKKKASYDSLIDSKKDLEAKLKAAKEASGESTSSWKDWKYVGLLILFGLITSVGGGVVGFLLGRVRTEEDDFEEPRPKKSAPFEINDDPDPQDSKDFDEEPTDDEKRADN